MSLVVTLLVGTGLFFLIVAAIGMVRLPDVYTRAHAVSLTDSLGAFFLLLGLAVHHGMSTSTLRILVVLALLYLLNPVIAHATVRAALRTGHRPVAEDRR
ncbi:MAG: monovalent cation/H(+) antiporter subunit G [Bryobacterales bacterium]|nr:monovalent cation/H(+) antiporter subunit G [Bryobacterales bacterium]